MTWTADIMPDDALPPDSLVWKTLNAKPTSNPKQIRTLEPEPLPLWRVMHDAGDKHLELTPLTQHKDWHLHAAEIEALRDWLLPEEATPLAAVRSYLPRPMIERMDERQRLRQLLTEQARIAREGQ